MRLSSYGWRSQPACAGRAGRSGSADPRRVLARAPRVALVAAHVVPRGELAVVVLPAGLEQVGMVGHEHRRHPGPPQVVGDRLLPQLDRAPRPPQEVERTGEQVVARRHARQRAGDVAVEAHRPGGQAVEVRRVELGRPVRPDQVAVEAVEQDDDDVARHRRGRRRGVDAHTAAYSAVSSALRRRAADDPRGHLVHHVGEHHVPADVVDDHRAAPAAPEADLVVGQVRQRLRDSGRP